LSASVSGSANEQKRLRQRVRQRQRRRAEATTQHTPEKKRRKRPSESRNLLGPCTTLVPNPRGSARELGSCERKERIKAPTPHDARSREQLPSNDSATARQAPGAKATYADEIGAESGFNHPRSQHKLERRAAGAGGGYARRPVPSPPPLPPPVRPREGTRRPRASAFLERARPRCSGADTPTFFCASLRVKESGRCQPRFRLSDGEKKQKDIAGGSGAGASRYFNSGDI